MSHLIDLSGQRFGRLVALRYERLGRRTFWHCVCDCGALHKVDTHNLRNGHARSCGCLNRECTSERNGTHRQTKTPTYRVWRAMLDRCYRAKSKAYPRYGGRGIAVCDRWRYSFENFLADMGERPPGLSIDRRDNEQGYSPQNCRWASSKEQSRNTSRNVLYELNGERMTLGQWAEKIGVPAITIRKRMEAGHSFEVAVSDKNLKYGSIVQSKRRHPIAAQK